MVKYCIKCGSKLAGIKPKFCAECGAKVPVDENINCKDNSLNKTILKNSVKTSNTQKIDDPITKELPNTGYYNVKDEYFNNRVRWAYYYNDSKSKRVLRNFHLDELKKAVLKKQLQWKIIDEDYAKKAREKERYFDQKYCPISKSNLNHKNAIHEKFKMFDKLSNQNQKQILNFEKKYDVVFIGIKNNTACFLVSTFVLECFAFDNHFDYDDDRWDEDGEYIGSKDWLLETFMEEVDWNSDLYLSIEISYNL